ncbi:MAG TPA: CtsR family transcriptional regulator [Firmicutes bacterium]|nr:CtsR family transcriptional regulator [Bacillota bacterium]
MATSDLIARFILQELDSQGFAELRRSSLAEQFSCVPSQINYVISTRFSPERGYVVESRRGGGGYIRIRRVKPSPGQLVMHIINSVGSSLEAGTAAAFVSNMLGDGTISESSAKLIRAATSDSALRPVPQQYRDEVRAAIFKQMLITIIS